MMRARLHRLRTCLALLLIAMGSWSGPGSAQSIGGGEPVKRNAFVTARDRTGSETPAFRYGEKRGALKAGYCDVVQSDFGVLNPIAEAAPFVATEDTLELTAIEEVAAAELFDGLGPGKPLVYVHGFYEDFDRNCRRAAILGGNLALGDRLLLFSWPSDGVLVNYARDEVDLYWSVRVLEDLILEMTARFGPGRIDLAGHSLGARGVVLALAGLGRRHAGEPLLDHVVLLAPDMDFGIFQQNLPDIRPLARSITVYVAGGDRPLALSAQLHGYPRLGQTGNDVASIAGVEVIDLSGVPTETVSGHLYHLYSEAVADDLRQLLNEGTLAAGRRNLEPAGENLWRLGTGTQ